MSLHRYQRGLRQLGMGAGSHLARPPAVLPEPDVRPSAARIITSINLTICDTLEVDNVDLSDNGVIDWGTAFNATHGHDHLRVTRKCGETRGSDAGYSDTGVGDPRGAAGHRSGQVVTHQSLQPEGTFWLYTGRDGTGGSDPFVMRFPIGAGTRGACHELLEAVLPGVDYIPDCAVDETFDTYGYGIAFGATGETSTLYRWLRSGEGSGGPDGFANPIEILAQYGIDPLYTALDIGTDGTLWLAGQETATEGVVLHVDEDGALISLDSTYDSLPQPISFLNAAAAWRGDAIVAGFTDSPTSEFDTVQVFRVFEDGGGQGRQSLNSLITIDGDSYADWTAANGEYIDPQNNNISIDGDRIVMRTSGSPRYILLGTISWDGG